MKKKEIKVLTLFVLVATGLFIGGFTYFDKPPEKLHKSLKASEKPTFIPSAPEDTATKIVEAKEEPLAELSDTLEVHPEKRIDSKSIKKKAVKSTRKKPSKKKMLSKPEQKGIDMNKKSLSTMQVGRGYIRGNDTLLLKADSIVFRDLVKRIEPLESKVEVYLYTFSRCPGNGMSADYDRDNSDNNREFILGSVWHQKGCGGDDICKFRISKDLRTLEAAEIDEEGNTLTFMSVDEWITVHYKS